MNTIIFVCIMNLPGESEPSIVLLSIDKPPRLVMLSICTACID